jgi:hypothetical protein
MKMGYSGSQIAGRTANTFPCRVVGRGYLSRAVLPPCGMVFMSYYRDVYLKSEEWKSLRLQRLEQANYKCELCGETKNSLDVHHLVYRRLFNVRPSDLRILCRDCHEAAHGLLKKYKKLKTLDRSTQWSIVKKHLAKGAPARKMRAICEWMELPMGRSKNMTRGARLMLAEKEFGIWRDFMVSFRIAKRDKLKWRQDFASHASLFPKPFSFLSYYIAATGIDPRYRAYRPIRLLSRSGLNPATI